MFRNTTAWASASILMSLPLLLALDYGGVLYWTQYVAALAIFAAFIFAIPSLFGRENSRGLKQHMLLVPMLMWGIYAALYTIPLPSSIVGFLSPASQEAYTTWIEPFVGADQLPSFFPITVDQSSTRHAVAVLWMLVAAIWTSAIVFNTRGRLTVLLTVIAASGTVIAAIGILRRMIPGFELWSFVDTGTPFATFVNRNNAALFLNLGLGCGLGLLAWRTSALTGQDVDDPEFEYSDLVSLTSDLQSMIGLFTVVICSAGLLIGGSRGGLVAAVAGMLLAFGWVRQARGVSTIAVVGIAMAICTAVLTVPTDLSLESIQRFEFNTQGNQATILRNGRLNHWPDGFQAAMAHFPMGSGLGTYGHAYLPHQNSTTGGWFEHADNLWLELFTEQGLIGILIVLIGLGIVVYSLSTLNESPDAIDHGVRIAGWFFIGSLLFSQCFDFGLVLPANGLIVCMLFAAVINRGVAHASAVEPIGPPEDSESEDSPRNITHQSLRDSTNKATKPRVRQLFERKRMMIASWGLATFLGLPLLLAVSRLGIDARSQSLAMSANNHYSEVKNDPEQLKDAIEEISIQASRSGLPELSSVASRYEVRLARFREVEAAKPVNERQQAEFFRMTSPTRRSQQNRDVRNRPVWVRDDALAFYEPALKHATETLLQCPLNRRARWEFSYLGFAHGDSEKAKTAIRQLTQLNRSSADQLVSLGRQSVIQNDIETAKRSFQRAIALFPHHSRTLFKDIRDSKALEFEEIIPEDPVAYQAIGPLALAETTQDDSVMSRSQLQHLRDMQQCDECKTGDEKVKCLLNTARMSYALQDFDESFEDYQKLIDLKPRSATVRTEYLKKLVEQDRRAEARKQAQMGKRLFPDTPYFEDALATIVARELRSE